MDESRALYASEFGSGSTIRRQRAFLEAFAVMGIISYAAERAGIHRQTVYDWLRVDPDFQKAYQHALEQANDLLERELFRRAVSGVVEPVYQGGRKVGSVRKYSDRLLELTLKARRPERFRERVDVSARVKAETAVSADDVVATLMEHLTPADLARLAEALVVEEPGDDNPPSGSAAG